MLAQIRTWDNIISVQMPSLDLNDTIALWEAAQTEAQNSQWGSWWQRAYCKAQKLFFLEHLMLQKHPTRWGRIISRKQLRQLLERW